MKVSKSKKIFANAQKVIPGGVNSPVRAFKAVGLEPFFVSQARGSKIYDADGQVYIDYVCSWGPMILGHAHPQVRQAMTKALAKGWSYGAATELEVRLAQLISKAIPSMEMMRLVSSGTEATMSAIRLARGFTGRDKIIKFAGCYHGHGDSFLVKAGSGTITFGIPDSAGIPKAIAETTLVAPYNDLEAVRQLFAQNPAQIAAVIVEPVAGNMGVVLPREGFLPGLANLCHEHGALLIFDEVISGFRASFGGVQQLFGVKPDLTCLGKIIGGGMPVGAYGGRREIMEKVAPLGPVYQAGTLSGNPIAMTCGLATLKILQNKKIYKKINKLTEDLCQGLAEIANRKGIPIRINKFSSMFTLFFTEGEVFDYDSAKKADPKKYALFFQKMLKGGVWFPPSQFEACFVSFAHTEKDIAQTLKAATTALEFE
ncbi:MAG: glutamate-1-semialdehyde 2,1-aminomutase [Thermodesulfobacteriota bacterium]